MVHFGQQLIKPRKLLVVSKNNIKNLEGTEAFKLLQHLLGTYVISCGMLAGRPVSPLGVQ